MTDTTTKWAPIINAVFNIAHRWLDEAKAVQARDQILDLADNQRTRIMLYGAYSAGKSTILNALVGEEVASMADEPTTEVVTDYRWGDLIVQDTPGVNAPIAHEAITEDALHGADLILFVLRAGEQDTQDVYDRLLRIIASGKPILIVLNYETRSANPGQFVAESHHAINQHLLALAPKHGITDEQLEHLQVIPLQARTALKAVTSSSDTLRVYSGLPSLTAALHTWADSIQASKGRDQAVADCLRRDLIYPALKTIEQQFPGGSSPELDEAHAELMTVRSEHRQLQAQVEAEATRLTAQARHPLQAIQCSAGSEDSRQQQLEVLFQQLLGELFQFMSKQLPDLRDALVPASVKIQATAPGSAQPAEPDGQFDELLHKARQLAPNLPEDALANAVTLVLNSGSKWALPLQKILQGGAGDFLKANSKYLGPAVAITLDVVEIGRAAWAEERYNQKLKAEEHRRQQQLSDWLRQITDSLSRQVNEALAVVMAPVLDAKQYNFDRLTEGQSLACKDQQTLRDLDDQL